MKPLSFPPCLRSLLYQRLNPLTPHRRTIHLWTNFRTTPMDRDIANFLPFNDYRPASKVFLNLKLTEDSPIQRLSLETVLESLLKPGHVLVRLPKPPESKGKSKSKSNIDTDTGAAEAHDQGQRYTIRNASLVRRLEAGAPPFAFGEYTKTKPKSLHFGMATTAEYLLDALQTGMHKLREGYKLEIHINRRGETNPKRLRRMLDECIHLRPDVILRSLPRKSGIVIQPQTDGRTVCWVVAPPFVRGGKDLEVPLDQTYSFYKKRERLLETIEAEGTRRPVKVIQKIAGGVMVTEEIYDIGGTVLNGSRGKEATPGKEENAAKGEETSVDEAHGEEESLADESDASGHANSSNG